MSLDELKSDETFLLNKLQKIIFTLETNKIIVYNTTVYVPIGQRKQPL